LVGVSVGPRPAVVIRVRFATRRQLKQAWLRELTKGSYFVRAEAPLPIGDGVILLFELPDGEQVQVDGEVVAAVPRESATPMRPAGMAVRLTGFAGEKRARLEGYLERNRTVVPNATQPLTAVGDRPGDGVPQPAMETLVRSVRRLVWLAGDAALLDDVDHYQILGLPPTARADEVREACTILRVLLDPRSPPEGLADRLTDEQRARVAALHDKVAQIERILIDPELRARYDAAVFSVVR
jgi:Tfp pilus assembly protein PilZ